jgi:hypothetical protein
MLREEFRQHLACEYRYAVTKMQEVTELHQKLFYFSAFFGEVQRVLNWEWNTELALVHMITIHTHTQIIAAMQMPAIVQAIPLDWTTYFQKLTEAASDLTTYFEKAGDEDNKEELYKVLGRFAEIAYAVSGNGSYLLEKGSFKL